MSWSYRNQSFGFHCKPIYLFLYATSRDIVKVCQMLPLLLVVLNSHIVPLTFPLNDWHYLLAPLKRTQNQNLEEWIAIDVVSMGSFLTPTQIRSCDAKGCQFWIHSSCYGFPNAEDDTFRNTEFYCKKHIQSKIKSKK